MVLYLFVFFNVCFCLSPKQGSIAVAVWNMLTSFVAMICFAVLSTTADEELVIYPNGDTFVSDTPERMKAAAGIFSVVFVLNAMLLWAAIKEKPMFLTAWMIGNLIVEIGILIFILEWPPTYKAHRAWNAVWYFRFALGMCFLRPVYAFIQTIVEPNPPTILVNTLTPDGTIKKGMTSINRV